MPQGALDQLPYIYIYINIIYIYIYTHISTHLPMIMYVSFINVEHHVDVSCKPHVASASTQRRALCGNLVRPHPVPGHSTGGQATDPCCVLRTGIHRPPTLSLGNATPVKCQIQTTILLAQSNRGTFAFPHIMCFSQVETTRRCSGAWKGTRASFRRLTTSSEPGAVKVQRA